MTIYGGKPGRDVWMLHPLCDEGDNGMVLLHLLGALRVILARQSRRDYAIPAAHDGGLGARVQPPVGPLRYPENS